MPHGVTVADPATVPAAPATSSPAPAVAGVTPVLDGTFRLDFDDAHQTVDGQPTTGGSQETNWFAFRSLCTSAGCVATGTALAAENHQIPIGGPSLVLRFTDGHWQNRPHLESSPCSTGTNQNSHQIALTSSLEPQPDGTLRGVQTGTSLTNECRDQGTVWRTPMVVTRTGDVPPAVVLADPALFESPAAPPTTGPR